MARIMPFRALRYDSGRIRLSDVVCPPYDVLTPAQADDYRARSPYNAIHLDLAGGEAQPAGADRYTRPAAELARWQAEGILIRDERPGFYLFEHSFREPGGRCARGAASSAACTSKTSPPA